MGIFVFRSPNRVPTFLVRDTCVSHLSKQPFFRSSKCKKGVNTSFTTMRQFFWVSAAAAILLIVAIDAEPVAVEPTFALPRTRFSRASPTAGDRPGCKPGAAAPPSRVDTTKRLADLRSHFSSNKINAYIITSDNAHQVSWTCKYVGAVSIARFNAE